MFSSLTLMWSPSGSGRRQQVLLGQDRDVSQVIADVGPDADEVSVSEALLEPGEMFYQIREDGGYTSPVRSFIVPSAEVAAETFQTSYTLLPGEVIAVRPLVYPGADDFAYVAIERTTDDLREDFPEWREVSRTTVPGGLLSVQAQGADRGYRIAVYGERVGEDTIELLFKQEANVRVIGGGAPVDRNNPPLLVSPIPDQSLTVGDPDVELDLQTYFADPDGDPLAFSVTSAAGVSRNGSTLTLSAGAAVNRNITVVASDQRGGIASYTFSFVVSGTDAPAVAAFSLNASADPVVALDASGSTGDAPLTYEWDLGNGEARSGQTLSYEYDDNGTYTITLTVTDNNGSADTATAEVTITGAATLSASFTQNVANDPQVSFDASGSTGDAPLAYAWDFGDGTTGAGVSPSHTYTQNGSYTVTLTVTEQGGAQATATSTVIVDGAGTVDAAASFTVDDTSSPLIAFDASASTGETPLSYAWDFGDGDSGSGVNPTHTYDSAGTYTVVLVVTGDDGSQDSAQQTVTIAATTNQPPVADIQATGIIPTGNEVTASGAGSSDPDGTVTEYAWTLTTPAGSSISLSSTDTQTVTFTPDVTGAYELELVVTDNQGAESPPASRTVNAVLPDVNQPPVAVLELSTAAPEVGTEVTADGTDSFDPGSAGLITQFQFSLNTPIGSNATLQGAFGQRVFTPDVAGTYTVRLVVTDDEGADSPEVSESITITDVPDNQQSTIGAIVQSASPSPYGQPVALSIPNRMGVEPDTATWLTLEGDSLGTSSDAGADFSVQIPAEYTWQDVTLRLVVTYPDGSQNVIPQYDVDLGANPSVPDPATNGGGSFTYDQEDVTVSDTLLSASNGGGHIKYDQTDVNAVPDPASASNGGGSIKYDQTDVEVSLGPEAGFSTSITDLEVSFTDTSTDDDYTITDWDWDFGDTNTSTDQNPTHTYGSAGTYTVSLTVTNSNSDEDTVTQDVTVTEPASPPDDASNGGGSLTYDQTDVATV